MQEENPDILVAILMGGLFFLLFGVVSFIVMFGYFKRKSRLLYEAQIRENHDRQELRNVQMEMQEHTFRIISQEIHDNVGQILSIAKLNLNIISLEQERNERWDVVNGLVADAINELRDIGKGFYADRLAEEGLVSAMRHQMTQLSKTGLFATSFETEVQAVMIERSKIIFLYRIVQEVLNNIIRHSGASRVSMNISRQDDEVSIIIKDDGKGFDRKSAGFKPGIGLSSIEERALMIGATLQIESSPGAGTIVTLVCK